MRIWNEYNRVCAKIDLDAIEYNIEMMKRNIKDGVKLMDVIKTDAYGHGALQIARLLSPKDYIWGFATASLDESLVLRQGGIEKELLVLGCIFPDQREAAILHGIRITVYTEEMAKEISDLAVKMEKQAYIHIKLDTGMGRIGFLIEDESVDKIAAISKLPNLVLEGMYTHFAKADETNKEFTQKQMTGYLKIRRLLQEKGVTFTYCHSSNSAGIIDVPEGHMDLVRAGIATYGLYPSEEVIKENVPLKPALSLISHVAHVKWVEAGTPISYGGTYVTQKRMKVATVPVGYGDGYPRSLSNKGYVLMYGQKAPILGRVCMDQFMVDVTEMEEVKYGDKVTLVGNEGDEKLPVEVLSDLSERFNYEFVCDLGKRIPREYYRHGEIVEQVDYFS